MLGSCPPGPLHIEAGRFLDTSGREVLLRGVNLGGDCKLPYPNGGTHVPSRFTDHRSVSFIGRPFPLGEADEHFGRLRHWGFNCLRLLTSGKRSSTPARASTTPPISTTSRSCAHGPGTSACTSTSTSTRTSGAG